MRRISVLLVMLSLLLCGSIFGAEGDVIWTRTYNGAADGKDIGHGIAVDGSGNVYVTGFETVTGESSNIWVRKYDSDGNEVWTRTYNGTANESDSGYGIAVDGSGNVYVTGYETVTGESNNIWVRKYDSDGNEVWTKTHNGTANLGDEGYDIAVDGSGNVYVTGVETVTGESYNIWVRKYDSDGNEVWTRSYNGTANGSDLGQGIAVDGSGNVYVTGSERMVTGEWYHTWVRKYDSDGNEVWTRIYNGDYGDSGYGIAVDGSGNVYVTGSEYVYGQSDNIWVRKYDSDGNEVWTRTYNGTANQFDLGWGIAVDGNSNVYVTGLETVTGESYNIWVRKYAGPNRPPDISAMPDSIIKNEGETITSSEIELATDLDGDPLTYTYSGWRTSLPYTTTFEDKGTHILHVDVSDGTDTVAKDITIVVYGADGLAGYWKFDEGSGTTAYDSSGMGNAGTLVNGPAWTTGKIGGALNFNGMDNYVDCGNGASLNLMGSLTLSAWIKPDSFSVEGGTSKIIDKGCHEPNCAPEDVGGFVFGINDDVIHWDPHSLTYVIYGGWVEDSDAYSVKLNEWQHVAVTYDDSSGELIFYVDGVNKGTYDYTGTINGYPMGSPKDSSIYPLVIGIRHQDMGGDFSGAIDEVRVYNRALSPAEILALYDEGAIHTVIGIAGLGGSIAPAGEIQVNAGHNVTFTITADTGYHIADVLVDGVSQGALASYTFSNVTANHTIEASFAINSYTLTMDAVNGSISKVPDKPAYNHGETITLTAIADPGYKFIDWSGDLTGNENPVAIIVDSDKSITAKFATIGQQFGDVSKVIPYPNPFRVNEAKNNTLKFINLPDKVVLQIFNIFGEMIYKEEYTATGGRIEWDGNNNYGRPVATGLYIYLVTDREGHKKTGRISLIR